MNGLRLRFFVLLAAFLLYAAARPQTAEDDSEEQELSDEEDADEDNYDDADRILVYDDDDEDSDERHCNKEFNLTESDYVGELSPNAKCYVNCIAEENNLIREGSVEKEAFSTVLYLYFSVTLDSDNEDILYTETTDCLNENIAEGDDKCDIAYTLYRCILQSLPKAERREFWTYAQLFSSKK